MLFWTSAAILTLVASLAVLLPVTRRAAAGNREASTIAVYRDQLAEVDRDASRGLVRADEAEQAKAEIGRRLLKMGADAADETARASSASQPRVLAAAAVLSVPLVAWGIYGIIGSPDLAGQPLAARLEQVPEQNSIAELVSRAEKHLAANPQDGRGWDVLAPIYMRVGRTDEAVTAYRNAIRLLGATAAREAGLGEAVSTAAGGIVTEEGRAAFERAVALDETEPKARYFLAVAMAQEGRLAEAIAGWEELAAALPADSPWRGAAGQAAEDARTRQTEQAGTAPALAEQPDDIDPAAQTEMIEQMVAGLDERLRATPDDPEGWKRLVRSYVVLGRDEQARDALMRGAEALGPGTQAAADLVAFAGTLGLGLKERTP